MAIPFGEEQKPEPALSQKSLVAMIKDKFANLTDERTGKIRSMKSVMLL